MTKKISLYIFFLFHQIVYPVILEITGLVSEMADQDQKLKNLSVVAR